jgi:hypothetical protein
MFTYGVTICVKLNPSTKVTLSFVLKLGVTSAKVDLLKKCQQAVWPLVALLGLCGYLMNQEAKWI